MTYTVAAALGVLAAVVLDVALLRTRLVLGRVFWCSYPIVFVFQLLSNGILTGRGVVLYNPDDILGVRLVHAPVEDLAFGFALVLSTLSLWTFLKRPPAKPSERPAGSPSERPAAKPSEGPAASPLKRSAASPPEPGPSGPPAPPR